MCFICISLIPAVSCAKKDDIPADKLSLIRYDVLVAEDDDVKIAVYLEKRESPYREDGNPAELKPHIVIKATAVDDFDIENADMAVVIGGDGTVLRNAKQDIQTDSHQCKQYRPDSRRLCPTEIFRL